MTEAYEIIEHSYDVVIVGPGRAGAGGVAVPGSHGIPPVRVRARPAVVPATRRVAVEASNERRDILNANCVCTIDAFS